MHACAVSNGQVRLLRGQGPIVRCAGENEERREPIRFRMSILSLDTYTKQENQAGMHLHHLSYHQVDLD